MMQQQSALVLHVRPYRESSAIVQFMTKEQGRIAGVVRGIRGASKRRNAMQPFSLGTLSYFGRSNLVNVSSFDCAHFFSLQGDALFGGLYLLELLTRLVAERQKEPVVFADAVSTLTSMEAGHDLQGCLRNFELDLLEQLGYGVVFDREIQTGAAIDPQKYYVFTPQQGFVAVVDDEQLNPKGDVLSGDWLLKVHARDFRQLESRRLAKHIVRQALQPLLGDKPLVSRKMLAPR
jgi:DNA repair protein RecO (recombination protein O)